MKVIKIILGFLLMIILSKSFAQGYLGVLVKDYDHSGIKGALILNILDDGAAKNSGLKENDIIAQLDNNAITNKSDLINLLNKKNWGDKIHLQYYRNGSLNHVDIILGYKRNTKTYNVHKKIIDKNQHWIFEDDNTVIVIDKTNQPISINKIGNGCLLDTWYIQQDYKDDEIPQCYLDLDDKLYTIERIKASQEKRKVTIDNIIYIKKITEGEQSKSKTEAIEKPILDFHTFGISPNPSDGLFTISIDTKSTTSFGIKILNASGLAVHETNVSSSGAGIIKQFDLRNLAKGIYLIQLAEVGNEQNVIAKKIIFK